MNLKNLDMKTLATSDKVPMGFSSFFLMNEHILLHHIPPKYPRVLAHHVTHEFGVSEEHCDSDRRVWQASPSIVRLYGYLNSGDGLECFLAEVDGIKRRPDGRLYHLTYSLRPDRYKPVDSNKLVLKKKYQPIKSIEWGSVLWWREF